MTTARTDLDAPLQGLIDARLDAIDRVLLRAGVSRGERCSIVEEVETQVYEILARRTEGEPARADVLAVLASLDPPEAYAPEGYRDRLARRDEEDRPRVPQPCLLAVGSAAGGVLILLLSLVLGYLLAGDGGELALLLGALVLLPGLAGVTTGGVLAIRRIRHSGGWLFGLPVALFAALLFPLLMLNGLLIAAVVLFQEIGLIAAAGLALVAANGYLVYHAWKAVSAGYRRATPATEGR
jgi:hypothetical protein